MSDYITSGVYYDTIGAGGTYAITADGAQGSGASHSGAAGGYGAAVGGDIYLAAGTELEICPNRAMAAAGRSWLNPRSATCTALTSSPPPARSP